MNTPIRDFVAKYAEAEKTRLHMPGHKGVSFLGVERYDITEIDGADVLTDAQGIIRESEKNASELFSSYRTFYSAEGSSLCIKAMLAIISQNRKNKSEKAKILAARNVHKAFIFGCAISDIDVEWIYPEVGSHICSCVVTANAVEDKLSASDGCFDAVYVTSPDYLGQLTDIGSIAAVCDRYSVPLLVDNAHGAYLAFTEECMHPIKLGAYMCCDSAHKTLPVLTGGAYLHLSEKAYAIEDCVKGMMSVMGSTSPSYLILQSLDMCNAYLSDGYRESLSCTVERIAELKAELEAENFVFTDDEPLKLAIELKRSGLNKNTFLEALKNSNIEPEFCDCDYGVLMFTTENTERDYSRLREAFSAMNRDTGLCADKTPEMTCYAQKAMSLREAVFSRCETVTVDDSVSRICASPAVSCPPAVPIVISGEIITKDLAEKMKYYGTATVDVVVE